MTLVNRFQLTGDAEEFEKVFAATSAFFAAQPGFVEHTLHRRLGDPSSYVNIARWADNASLRAAVAQPEFQPHSAALRALAVSSPELFEARLQVTAGDAE
ncbi:antibiotic biosynthesis monooxygenase [Streptomyces sp. B21-106]|uniref:antibiotic biosynthesis monooxygenase family protein n=1 Tax=Streptomyces sp. B21-106 TaxID=3039418 RepID=UPI002FF15077